MSAHSAPTVGLPCNSVSLNPAGQEASSVSSANLFNIYPRQAISRLILLKSMSYICSVKHFLPFSLHEAFKALSFPGIRDSRNGIPIRHAGIDYRHVMLVKITGKF
jgi:hypothetical protein